MFGGSFGLVLRQDKKGVKNEEGERAHFPSGFCGSINVSAVAIKISTPIWPAAVVELHNEKTIELWWESER